MKPSEPMSKTLRQFGCTTIALLLGGLIACDYVLAQTEVDKSPVIIKSSKSPDQLLYVQDGAAKATPVDRIRSALQNWERSQRRGQSEILVQNGVLIVKVIVHSCFALVWSADLSDLNLAEAYARPNSSKGRESESHIVIPCRDKHRCVTVEYGRVWLAEKSCSTTIPALRDTMHEDELGLTSIPRELAEASVQDLKN